MIKVQLLLVLSGKTLNAEGVGPEKCRFKFECLGILLPVLVRLVCDIYPGVDSISQYRGCHMQTLTMFPKKYN